MTRFVPVLCLVVVTAFFAAPAAGQTVVTGHYPPTVASGLKSGILPTGSGLIYQNWTFFYYTDSFKDNRDVTPGDTLTPKGGSARVVSETVRVGVIGHLYRRITGTKGRDAVDPLKCRSYGVGLQVGCLPGGSVPTKSRLGFDFGARNLTEGQWVVLEFNVLF